MEQTTREECKEALQEIFQTPKPNIFCVYVHVCVYVCVNSQSNINIILT